MFAYVPAELSLTFVLGFAFRANMAPRDRGPSVAAAHLIRTVRCAMAASNSTHS